MGLAQILCNGLQRDKERAGIKHHYAETKHRGILRSRGRKRRVSPFDILRATEVVRIPAAESPLLSSPLQRGKQEKTKQNKTKKGRPKANMRREVRTDSLTRKSTSPSGTSGRPTFVNVEFLPKYVWPCTAPGLENWSTPNKQPTKKLDRRIRVPQRFLTSSGSVDWRGREIAIVSNNNSAVAVYLDSV